LCKEGELLTPKLFDNGDFLLKTVFQFKVYFLFSIAEYFINIQDPVAMVNAFSKTESR
jgi:hypothetical protein